MAQYEGAKRRTGRAVAPPQSSARSSALQELLDLKNSGRKRINNFEVRLEDKVYDTLSEADYDRHVAKRREEAADFVVDDEGLGYVDGEEEDEDEWESEQSEDGNEIPAKRTKHQDVKKKEGPSRRSIELAAAAALTGKRRVTSMFAAASGTAFRRHNDERSASNRVGASTESILEDVLAGITADNTDRQRERQRRRGFTGLPVGDNLPRGSPKVDQSPSLWQPPLRPVSGTVLVQGPSTRSGSAPHAELLLKKEPSNVAVNGALECIPDDSKPQIPCTAIEEAAMNIEETVTTTPDRGSTELQFIPSEIEVSEECREPSVDVGIVVVKAGKSEVKSGLNARINAPSDNVERASSAWHSLREGGAMKKEQDVIKDEALDENLYSDDNVLPVDADGKLPFYLLDAHEEDFGPYPGTIYLFGKVPKGGKGNYVSCCVVVRNLHRCIYAVPAPSVFPENSFAELEEAVKSGNNTEKLALKSKLQDLARDLKMELAEKLLERNIVWFTMVPVKRSYAFELPHVPVGEHYFMKLSYPFKDGPLPSDLHGVHFTHLFGTHTSALELFLIKRKIKGPCWLLISSPKRCSRPAQVSWCNLEINVESPKDLGVASTGKTPVETPQLVVAAINLKTVLNHKDNVNEIASASVVYSRHVKVDMPMPLAEWNTHEMLNHFSIVRKLDGEIFPVGFTSEVAQINSKMGTSVLTHETSERALLNLLMVKLHQLDPDVLVGHNISGYDLDVLLHRVQACKVQSKVWSKVGRLRRSQMPRLNGGGNTFGSGAGPGHMACVAGRLLCDTYLSARELLRETSYSLTELARNQLGRERKELVPSEIPTMYRSSSALLELVESGETDAWLSLGLMFHLSVLPLTRQLTNISGNLWNRTLQGSRAQRVEYLLLHEFHGRKFIVPDKLSLREKEILTSKRKPGVHQATINGLDEMMADEERVLHGPQSTSGKRRKGPAYLGGLVLEPKKGLYDKFILLLDFNSLYPSIIQEYNICFTTVDRSSDGLICRLPSTDSPGVLPQVLKGLVDRRKQVKAWLKRTTDLLKYQQFDIQQQALKLTANSVYGCLGFSNARFYAKPLAELITGQGREILQSTVDLVRTSLNLEVIYGDTDSIMIHTGLDDLKAASAIGVKVIKEVNKKYRLLEIDMDGIYKRMLLLKKKKYAAVKIEVANDGTIKEVMEQKGLDIVRRDWSLLSKDIGNFVLKQILSGGSREEVVETIHEELRKLQEEMRNGQVDLDKFTISKTLTKSPEDYPDAKNQPHVQVALRRKRAGHQTGCSAGDTVPYIICVEQGPTGVAGSLGIAERARHPDELKIDSDTWMVDIEYYISQQVHPVVSRLCAPIEGTDAQRIADCLGLDPSKFHRAKVVNNDREEAQLSTTTFLDDDDRYRHCEALELVCPRCTNRFRFPGLGHMLADLSAQPGKAEANDLLPSGDLLSCPRCTQDGCAEPLSPAMLVNQVIQRADEFIARYYDGAMCCDEDSCGLATRNISLRVAGDAGKGSVCPNYPRCSGHLSRQYTEVELYKQLIHFYRLLDPARALEKVVDANGKVAAELKLSMISPALNAAAEAIKDLRDRSGYRWVQLSCICVST